MKRFLSLWLPVLVWAAFIFYLSGIPYLRITEAWYDIILRKMAHMFVFGVLARLLARAFTSSTFWSWKRVFTWSLVLAFLYACSDEYHQSFVPGRGGSALDVVLFDTTGAGLALGIIP
jgi:VanZ family protein